MALTQHQLLFADRRALPSTLSGQDGQGWSAYAFPAFTPDRADWLKFDKNDDIDMKDALDVFQATAGLPEEILLSILLDLVPSERAPLARVCSTWNKLIQKSWLAPWGRVEGGLGFHVLVPSRILRQSIPHVAWTIPDFVRLPRGVSLVSPPFALRESNQIFGRNIQWRLRVQRTGSDKSQADSEADDLQVSIEVIRPKDLTDEPMTFNLFCRIENPASYAWGHNETKKVQLSRGSASAKAISHVHSVIADRNKGYLTPGDHDSITILCSVLPESHEYVTIFSLDDCRANDGADLLRPSSRTPVLTLPRKWNALSQGASQQMLKTEYLKMRPDVYPHTLQFWRVVMRRNNTFRPVSPELKSYEEPFYAVFAHHVKESDREKACLFVKIYDGEKLSFFDQIFIDRGESFVDLLRRLGKPPTEYALFEEVHSRRVDQITDLTRSLRTVDIGDGDIVVLVQHRHSHLISAHYQKIVYTSPLVTVSPNMWHS